MNEELLSKIKEYLKDNLKVIIVNTSNDTFSIKLILDGEVISCDYS